MFEFDELEASRPAEPALPDTVAEELKRLRGENRRLRDRLGLGLGGGGGGSGGRALRLRGRADPLATWFPLEHAPPGAGPLRGCLLCLGPPSASAASWAEPALQRDEGPRLQPEAAPPGLDLGDNVLVQHLTHKRQELLLAQRPEGTEGGLAGAARALAELLAGRLAAEDWELLGLGVGAWLAAALLEELRAQSPGAWGRCRRLHAVGFPPPDEALGAAVPPGMAQEDLDFARSLRPMQPRLPCPVQVCFFPACLEIFPLDRMKGWSKLFEADGTAPVLAGLPGDQGLLSSPLHRHDAFWVITKLGVGVNPPVGKTDVQAYRDACTRDGIPPRRAGLFDELGDARLLEIGATPHMRPFQKHMPSGREPHMLADSFATGQCGVDNGIDLRYWADTSTEEGLKKDGVGCRTVSLVRFGWRAGASVNPADGAIVHGGAIGAVMDEATAECMKFWIQPCCSTRRIEHQLLRATLPYTTYRVECTIEGAKSAGCLVDVRGVMRDAAGGACCITRAEMVDLEAFGTGAGSWW